MKINLIMENIYETYWPKYLYHIGKDSFGNAKISVRTNLRVKDSEDNWVDVPFLRDLCYDKADYEVHEALHAVTEQLIQIVTIYADEYKENPPPVGKHPPSAVRSFDE
jgi:hypothetical protein